MELRRYLQVLRNRWLVILLIACVGLLGAYVTTPQATTYTASSTLYIGSRIISDQSGQTDLSGDRALALERLSRTFAIMIETRTIAAQALARTDVARSVDEIADATTATSQFGTQLLDISVTDSDPAVAAAVANGLADSFVEAVQNYEPESPQQAEGALPTLPAYVFERATLPTVPNPNNLLFNLVIGLVIGTLTGVGLVLLLDYLDITVHDAHDAEARLELAVLGVIPPFGDHLPVGPGARTTAASLVRPS
jgi:capsular polysaccharide biosynthesis protein